MGRGSHQNDHRSRSTRTEAFHQNGYVQSTCNTKRLQAVHSIVEEGDRPITKAYVSDKYGNPVVRAGNYAVLELQIGPDHSLGSPLHYDVSTGLNDWIDINITITQQKKISTPHGNISGLVADTFAGGTRVLVDQFTTGKRTDGQITLTYASYAPAKDKKKNPLLIWLHGGGEGGTDATIPLSANKAVNLASREIQSYFAGAYILVPQAPTKWMDGMTGVADGTSIYEEALMNLINDVISNNPDIDPNRVYIGGASNGGYMTMLMIRDYPGTFAAAFPVCEGLDDQLITDVDIQAIKKTPIWFVTAKNDTTLPADRYTIPTYHRLRKAGASDVQLFLFDDVHDTSGLYKQADGTPYQYNGHWSWIYVFNNEVSKTFGGKRITLMDG